MNTDVPEFWVKTQWLLKELDGKRVEFELTAPEKSISGIGVFRISQRPSGEQRVEIVVASAQSASERTEHIFTLRQIHADRVQRHPSQSVAEFQLLA